MSHADVMVLSGPARRKICAADDGESDIFGGGGGTFGRHGGEYEAGFGDAGRAGDAGRSRHVKVI